MKTILFLISISIILITIYIAIRIMEKVLSLFKGAVKTLAIITFMLSVIAIFTTPEEFGLLLQPILKHFSSFIDWAFNGLYGIYKYIIDLPEETPTLSYYLWKIFDYE